MAFLACFCFDITLGNEAIGALLTCLLAFHDCFCFDIGFLPNRKVHGILLKNLKPLTIDHFLLSLPDGKTHFEAGFSHHTGGHLPPPRKK